MPSVHKDLASRYPVALVSGASSGIGLALAELLVEAGLTVYGTSRQPDRPGLHPDIHWLPFQGASLEGIYAFVRDHPDLLSKVNLLVNNAGSGCFGTIDSIPRESLSQNHTLLLEGPIQLTRAVLPGMRGRGQGAIVNISSLAAIFPLPFMASYSAGKAGLSAFTRSLMLTERQSSIAFIDFQPGDYRTDFNANTSRHGAASDNQLRTWNRFEANLAHGPEAAQAARDIARALHRGRSAVVRSGGFFQRSVAPLGARLLPTRLLLWAIRKYCRISDA